MRNIIFGLLFLFSGMADGLENKLRDQPSPYLAMHGNDPVAWQLWSRHSFELAKKENKLLYVSSGYFSCHWCHVMQHESYQDKKVAKLLNENFIPVKVDREISAGLDSKLVDFVEKTQGRAGWPLNIFITPDGYPLVGMTYLPTSNFVEVLTKIQFKWKNENAELEKIARNNTRALSASSQQHVEAANANSGKQLMKAFLYQSRSMVDELSGGFGEQSKFPSVPQLSVLLQIYKQNHDIHLRQFLQLTLDNMAEKGLYDHLGGGFFRYVIDPQWQVPHFEKMLYDNALLASLYMDAAKIIKKDQYNEIAKETLDFMLSTFRSPRGGMIASLSAIDRNGIEGGYYLWQEHELKKILNMEEFRLVKEIWDLHGIPESPAGHHLVMTTSLPDAAQKLSIYKQKAEKIFASAKAKMLLVRGNRQLPRDNKLLAGWNGLALSAFSRAAKEYKSKKYMDAARAIKNYIYQNLWRSSSLVRAFKNNRVYAMADLEDYAYVANGLSDWLKINSSQAEHEHDTDWLGHLIKQAWSRFYIKSEWRRTENALLKYKQGEKVIVDDILPSASALMIKTTRDYCNKTHNKKLMKKAVLALNASIAEMSDQPFWYANQIYALYKFQNSNK